MRASRAIRAGIAAALVGLTLAGCELPNRLVVAPVRAIAPAASLSASVAGPAPSVVGPAPSVAGPAVLPAAGGGPAISPDARPEHWVVSLKANRSSEAFRAGLAAQGLTPGAEMVLRGQPVLAVGWGPASDRETARARLLGMPGVSAVWGDRFIHLARYAFAKPDSRLGEQWAHRPDRANTQGAWGLVPASAQGKVIVAVLDSGLDVTHPEFAGRVVGAQAFSDGQAPTADVTDLEGHGTHVAGIAAAQGDNGIGVAGVAWGVKLMPVKVVGSHSTGFDLVRGLDYAIHYRPVPDDGSRVRVINLSLGVPEGGVDQLYTQVVADAQAAGIVVVAAAGNDGRPQVSIPASTPGAIAVGATSNYLGWEWLASFSNFGDRLDLVAPGDNILSTYPLAGTPSDPNTQGYATLSGTSMAAPFVAGVAALTMAKYDPANARLDAGFARGVRDRLLGACTDLGAPGVDDRYGHGRIDAGRAVTPDTLDAAP